MSRLALAALAFLAGCRTARVGESTMTAMAIPGGSRVVIADLLTRAMLNRGYQVRQAITAVGAGGLFGRGLGFGSQSQLKFIPASQTDFIFAVIAEELGFLGVGLVLFFFFLLFYRLIRAAKLMRDNFSVFFILGVSALLFSHLAINVGMNVGLAPVTGISLPFLSYGGSFLVACLILIGVVENMLIRNRG